VESIDQVWLFVAIALAAGAVLGAILHKMLSSSAGDADKLRVELERTRSEMERYKASVNTHFSKTSDLVSELTQDYVKVYQHLAEGAQTLSDSPEFKQMLEHSDGKVLISVEEDTPEPEPVVVEPPADALEPEPVDEAATHGENAEDARDSDRRAPADAGDDPSVAEEDRRDPPIGDSDQDADHEASITPAAQQEEVAPQHGDPDSARKI